jgi:hypothetical protein
MDEPRLEELLYRIETLEREKRRWKLIGIGSLSIVLVLLALGGVFSVGTAILAREAALRERDAVEQARQAEMRERDAAERARWEALQAEQRARQAAEKKVREDGR